MIELRDVNKVYHTGMSTVYALKTVSMQVKQGDFTIIKGPSGSGKSTLLNILGLLDEPSEGTVTLEGQQVSYQDFDRLAVTRSHYMSFIFQSFNLNPVLTLYENVMVPLMVRNDIAPSEKRRRVLEWIEHTGLEKHITHRPEELSGGQRQRVAIARAMVTKPKMVIADEPTANLDSKTSTNIISLMKSLNTQEGTAFIFATHDSLLEQFANDVKILKDGVFL